METRVTVLRTPCIVGYAWRMPWSLPTYVQLRGTCQSSKRRPAVR